MCIEEGDPNFVGLTPRPEEGTPAATMRKWAEANAKARRVIVCALGTDPLTRFGGMLADCTAKELWDELARAYSTSNAQAIINLERQLEELSFDDKGDWQKHINSFHELTGELDSNGSVITSDQKKFKLMRTLPDSLAPIAMIANTTQMDFDGMVDSVQAELARRRASSSRAGPSNPSAAAAQAPRDMNLGMQRGVNKKKNRACWICHRRGHYANECFYRTRGDDSGGRGRGNGRGRGRGRGGRGRSRGMYRGGFQGGQYFNSYQNPPGPFANGPPVQYGSHPTANQPQQPQHGHPQAPQANMHHAGQPSAPPTTHQGQGSGGAGPSGTQTSPGFYGFMAKVKFRSTIAEVDAKKSGEMLIDSGGTHHFFHDRSLFRDFKDIEPKQVLSASGPSEISGTGEVWIPLNGGMWIAAFYTPNFSTHILSVHQLSVDFDLSFTRDAEGYKDLSVCAIRKRQTGDIVEVIPASDGLYPLTPAPEPKLQAK